MNDFTTTFLVDQSPATVFAAVTDPRAWWSREIDGPTDELDGIFDYHYRDVHRSRMQVVELVPYETVVWRCLDNYFDFTQDKTEWTGTTVRFEISVVGTQTQLTFTHVGLVPEYECFDVCTNAWGGYIGGSLKSLITTGTGAPNNDERNAEALQQRR